MEKKIITIGRRYGSGGRLSVNWLVWWVGIYDKEIDQPERLKAACGEASADENGIPGSLPSFSYGISMN